MSKPFNYKEFWKQRYVEHNFNQFYCGNTGKTLEENKEIVDNRIRIFGDLLKKFNINKKAKILDIGCGIGTYAEYLKRNKYVNYTGIELLDGIVLQLKKRFPDYNFIQKDICREKLTGKYDLIMFISVLQHITGDEHFDFIMDNAKRMLNKNGLLLVTDTLENKRASSYIRRRSFDTYLDSLKPLKFKLMKDFEVLKILCFK